MLILPHTTDLNLARKPWISWTVVVLSLLIHMAQESNRNEIMVAATDYCSEVFADPAMTEKIVWETTDVCASELADLRSLPDPGLMIDSLEQAPELFPSWSPEDLDYYYKVLRENYSAFKQIAPPSLDAKLMYDPTVPNPWRMITSALAHADWWHVIGNLIFFIAFAPALELISGRLRFIGIMLLITLADSLVYSIATFANGWPAPTLGLSGIVSGLIGLAAYVMPRVRIRTLIWFFFYVRNHSFPAWVLAAWFIGWDAWYLLTQTDTGGVNLVSHVSGGISGYMIGVFLMQNQRDEYRGEIDEAVKYQQEKRADILGTNTHNVGNYRRIIEQKQMKAAEAEYESRMDDVFSSVSLGNDSTAIMILLEDYELWAKSPEVYEEMFHRMQQWGNSWTLLCIGRLVIHLYAKQGFTAKAQFIASECLALNPDFVLADKLDLVNMFQNTTDEQVHRMSQQLKHNLQKK